MMEYNRLKYLPNIEIDLASVFEKRWSKWLADRPFLEQYRSAIEEDGLRVGEYELILDEDGSAVGEYGLILEEDGSAVQVWKILNKIFSSSIFSEEFKRALIVEDTDIQIRELLIISVIMPTDDPLYQTLLETIEQYRASCSAQLLRSSDNPAPVIDVQDENLEAQSS
jgi:hypothetical protein